MAIQGQDPRGARLAVRARSSGLTAADVDRALTEDRTLLITWLNRGTLHLVRSEDYPWLHALTAPRLVKGSLRRLSQEGVEPDAADRGVAAIERALASDGPLSRDELVERLGHERQALYHLLFLASLRGVCIRGPMVDGRHAYVLVRDWLGEQPEVDGDAALAELARRYLAGHGPADDRDLAKWAGLPLRDARKGLGAIGAEKLKAPKTLSPPPRLLGAFDPVLLGWADRTFIVGEHLNELVAGGIFRPFALVRGRAAATWRLGREGVELSPFAELSAGERAALDGDAADVERFLG